MPLECKKYHGKCAARCCGVVPIPRTIWQRNQHNIQREVVSAHKCLAGKDEASQVTAILPFTEDLLCPFLKPDLSCAIYDERPEVCRKFGDETHIMMCCPMQKADGKPRSEDEQREYNERADTYIASSGRCGTD